MWSKALAQRSERSKLAVLESDCAVVHIWKGCRTVVRRTWTVGFLSCFVMVGGLLNTYTSLGFSWIFLRPSDFCFSFFWGIRNGARRVCGVPALL